MTVFSTPTAWSTDTPLSQGNLNTLTQAINYLKEVVDGLNAVKIPNAALATGIDGAKLSAGSVSSIAMAIANAVWNMVNKAFADTPYTVPSWGYHVDVDASGGAVTVNLPTAVGNGGALIEVAKTDSSVNTVTIDANGAETIDNPPAATFVLYSQGDTVSLRSNNVNVLVV